MGAALSGKFNNDQSRLANFLLTRHLLNYLGCNYYITTTDNQTTCTYAIVEPDIQDIRK